MNKKGFTLIETMVVIILFAFIGVICINLFSSTLRGASKTAIINEIKQNGSHAVSIMERMIRNADSVSSVCNGLPQLLVTIVNNDGNQSSLQIINDPVASVDKVASVSSWLTGPYVGLPETIYLTSDNIMVKGLPDSYFKCTRTVGISDKIEMVLTIEQKGTNLPIEKKASMRFQTSVGLRN